MSCKVFFVIVLQLCFRLAFSPALKSESMGFNGVNFMSNKVGVGRDEFGGRVEGQCSFTDVDMVRVKRSLLSQFEEVYFKEMFDNLIN